MIMRFLKKVPAGMMVVPLLLGALFNTFMPEVLEIGSLTTAVFSNAGTNTLLGAQLFFMGTSMEVKDIPKVLKRGGVLLVGKFAIGAILGILVGIIFGPAGVLGISTLAIISGVTNSNGSLYLSLVSEYGDEVDAAAFPLLALNDGPFFTLVALGASGLASIPFMSLLGAVVPILIGMLLGNLDKGIRDLFSPMATAIIPLIGFSLGTGINLLDVLRGGISGILLGLITVFVSGSFVVLLDRVVSKRPGYAGWAVSTTAGNAVGVPAAVASVDQAMAAFVPTATVQIAASVVVTAILIPLITSWWAKKFGSPKYPIEAEASTRISEEL